MEANKKGVKNEGGVGRGKESRDMHALFPSQPCSTKGRLMSYVNAQSAEEALINLDCTIGTLFKLV